MFARARRRLAASVLPMAAAALWTACAARAPEPPRGGAERASSAATDPARWYRRGHSNEGVLLPTGRLVLMLGDRALVDADGHVRTATAPNPEPLVELRLVPTAHGNVVVGRGSRGLYRFDDPLGAGALIAAGFIEGMGTGPGLVGIREREGFRWIDLDGHAATFGPAPEAQWGEFIDMRRGVLWMPSIGLAATTDGGVSWHLLRPSIEAPWWTSPGLHSTNDGRLVVGDEAVDLDTDHFARFTPLKEAPLIQWLRRTKTAPLEAVAMGGVSAGPGRAGVLGPGLFMVVDTVSGAPLSFAEVSFPWDSRGRLPVWRAVAREGEVLFFNGDEEPERSAGKRIGGRRYRDRIVYRMARPVGATPPVLEGFVDAGPEPTVTASGRLVFSQPIQRPGEERTVVLAEDEASGEPLSRLVETVDGWVAVRTLAGARPSIRPLGPGRVGAFHGRAALYGENALQLSLDGGSTWHAFPSPGADYPSALRVSELGLVTGDYFRLGWGPQAPIDLAVPVFPPVAFAKRPVLKPLRCTTVRRDEPEASTGGAVLDEQTALDRPTAEVMKGAGGRRRMSVSWRDRLEVPAKTRHAEGALPPDLETMLDLEVAAERDRALFLFKGARRAFVARASGGALEWSAYVGTTGDLRASSIANDGSAAWVAGPEVWSWPAGRHPRVVGTLAFGPVSIGVEPGGAVVVVVPGPTRTAMRRIAPDAADTTSLSGWEAAPWSRDTVLALPACQSRRHAPVSLEVSELTADWPGARPETCPRIEMKLRLSAEGACVESVRSDDPSALRADLVARRAQAVVDAAQAPSALSCSWSPVRSLTTPRAD